MKSRLIIPENIKGECLHYTYAHIACDEHYPFYIGIGTQVKGGRKWGRGLSKSRSENWKNYLSGRDYLVIICTETNDYALCKAQEVECISELGKKSIDETNYLVNISDGGEGCTGYKHTEEHKELLRKRMLIDNPMKGRKHSEETKKRMSHSHKGRPPMAEETKEVLRRKMLSRGYMGEKGGLHHKARKVNQICPETGLVIKTFLTLRFAAQELGTSDKAIGKACREGFKVKKFHWKYAEEKK